MLRKFCVLCLCVGAGVVELAWSHESPLSYEDAIVSASQFEDGLVREESVQNLAAFVASVKTGDDKRSVNSLLGMPYSVEHLPQGVRWGYNVSIPTSTDRFIGCQFRVEFNASGLVRAADWHKSVCDLLYQQWVTPNADRYERQGEVFSFLSDVLFGFNRHQLGVRGTQELDHFLAQLRNKYHRPLVTITGHTDRIGSEKVNLKISMLRARAVGRYFEKQGVPANTVLVKGMGETDPVVVCADDKQDLELVDCLSPNRRVEIEVYEMPDQS